MDVIQARGLAFFEEIYGISKVSDGEICQYGFMAAGFVYRICVAYLAVEQEWEDNRVRCNVPLAD